MGRVFLETKIDGETLQFELPSSAGEIPTGKTGDTIHKVGEKVGEEFMEAIRAIGNIATRARSSFEKAPAEVTVECGLSVDANARVFVANSTVGAHIVITFKWTD